LFTSCVPTSTCALNDALLEVISRTDLKDGNGCMQILHELKWKDALLILEAHVKEQVRIHLNGLDRIPVHTIVQCDHRSYVRGIFQVLFDPASTDQDHVDFLRYGSMFGPQSPRRGSE